MSHPGSDPLRRLAEQFADCVASTGYAFIEDDKIEILAGLLGSFLATEGIAVNPPEMEIGGQHQEPG